MLNIHLGFYYNFPIRNVKTFRLGLYYIKYSHFSIFRNAWPMRSDDYIDGFPK